MIKIEEHRKFAGLIKSCIISQFSSGKYYISILSEQRLVKLKRDLSRKQKNSNNRRKARLKVAKLHERIANQRKDFLQKLSIKLIRENQSIVIEDLKVKNMQHNHKLAKAISEASWSEFRKMLTYKAKW